MNKLEKLADRLQASIDFATEHNEDFEASSWNYQEGVLLNHNEAKLVVELVKNLSIHDVVNNDSGVCPNKKDCKIIMFTSDLDICQKCNTTFEGK